MADETTIVENTKTDAILWYNVGLYGELGYAVPNPSDDIGSLNPNILDITNLIGKNVFLIMHHEDADLTTPPSLNTLIRVHQLYVRSGQILSGRAVPPNEAMMETDHVSPAGEVFRVWPVPYFRVRNTYMKRWAQWALMCLSDCFQHTENRRTVEITTTFSAVVAKYMQRIYQMMAVELFGKTRAEALEPAFVLTEADFQSYDPAKFFTSQEMIDTVPGLDNVFTEDRKRHLAGGVPLTELPVLQPWPTNLISSYEKLRKARESMVNPDTGQQNQDSDLTTNSPVFPQTSTFIL